MRPFNRTGGGGGAFLNMVLTYWVRRIMIAVVVCSIAAAVSRAWLGADWWRYLIVTPQALWGAGIPLENGLALPNIPAFWQVLTYPYFETSLLGFVFGILILGWFAGQMELRWGSRRFLINFLILTIAPVLLAALVGAVFPVVGIIPIAGTHISMVGIFTAWALTHRNQTILAFFVFPMKAIHMLYLMVGVGVLMALFGGPATVLAGLPRAFAFGLGALIVADRGSLRRVGLRIKKARIEYQFKREEARRKKRMDEVGLRVVGEEEDDDDEKKPNKWLH